MKPTKALNLTMAAALGWALTFVLIKFTQASGGAIPLIPTSLIITLASIAVIELLVAIPIFKFRRDLARIAKTKKAPRRVDAFYAVRVLALAKATAIFAALFIGFTTALLIAQLLLPVWPQTIWKNIVALAVSILLLAIALIIENACKLPKPDPQADANAEINPA